MQEASLNAKAQFGKRAETGAFLPFLDPVGKVNKGSTLPVREAVGERSVFAHSRRSKRRLRATAIRPLAKRHGAKHRFEPLRPTPAPSPRLESLGPAC